MGAGTAQGGACLLISGKVRKNMEFVVFAGVLLLLFIFMIVQELIQTKNQEKLFKKYLRENYGKEHRRNIHWSGLQDWAAIWNGIRKRSSWMISHGTIWEWTRSFAGSTGPILRRERNICTIRSGIFPAGERHWNIWKKWLTGCRSRRI